MRIADEVLKTEVPQIAGDIRVPIWVALLVMDEREDTGLTTGYYWRVIDPGAEKHEENDLEQWRAATLEGHGAYRSAQNAMAAVAYYTVRRENLASRLNEACEAMRSGNLDDTLEEVSQWLHQADELDKTAEAEASSRQSPNSPQPSQTQ